MIRQASSIAAGYVLAAASVALVTAIRVTAAPFLHELIPFSLYFLSVALTIWLAGLGPSIFAAVGGLVVGTVASYLTRPIPSIETIFFSAAIYLVISAWMIATTEKVRRIQGERGAIVPLADVNRCTAAEQQLNPTINWLELAQCAAHIGTFEWDIRTNRSKWTSEMEALYGVPKGQYEGTYAAWEQRVYPEDLPQANESLKQVLHAREPVKLEFRIVRPGGEIRWVSCCAEAVRDETGEPVRVVGVNFDITEQKRNAEVLEAKIAERTRSLQSMVAELETFSHSITHDLRAPLRAVHGYARMLSQEPACSQSPAIDDIRRIMSAVERMDMLIRDALNYSKILRGDMPLEPVDVPSVLRGVLESYPLLQPSCADIQVEGEFPLVQANEAALTQCLANLLANAVKFVPSGTKPRVRIWSEPRQEYVRIWVEDNGIGIAPEYHERIFEMFQQLDKGYAGTGVGLAIVRKAAERMGGRVGVLSEPGKGSRFWIELRPAAV